MALLHWRLFVGISRPAFLHRLCCMAAFLVCVSFFSLINNIRHRTTALAICERKIAFFVRFYQQLLPDGPPASNKPHPAEKSTPVWLAIWRTWAGFANSQHRDAAYAASNNICAHFPLLPQRVAAQTDANLSAHLHRLPTPPPYLRRMRQLPGRVQVSDG